jgi:4-amino-4-deoxy-L-arabinose transferase-like glycosyltransferase
MSKRNQILILAVLLLSGFLVRLYKIDNPVADWHSWRQADTSAVTRNYVKYGIDLFRPRYDDLSDVSGKGLFNPDGYRFVEFPVFNLAHLVIYKALPFLTLEITGRLTAIFSSLVSAWLIFLIVRRHSTPVSALLSVGFFLFLPYNIYYSRVILPDPLMVTLFLASLNCFDVWFANGQKKNLFFGSILGGLAVLVKPVALFFLLPLVWQFWKKFKFKVFRKWEVILSVVGILLPFGLWRLWENNFPQGIPANMWLLNGNKIRFKGSFFRWIFGERVAYLILGSWGLFPFISGIISAVSTNFYLITWVLSAVLYLFTFATGNIQHDYYQIPIIPVMAVMLSLGSIHLWRKESSFLSTWAKRGILITSLGFMMAFTWYQIRGLYQVNHWEIVAAGKAVDRLTPKDAVVVAPYTGDTAFLYQTNRRGFPFMYLPIKDFIDRFGASYYVSVNYDDQTNAIMNKYIVVEKTPQYVVVKLEEPIRP